MAKKDHERCCQESKIPCGSKYSISLIRLKTSIRATCAIFIASIFYFVPETELILDSSWAILLIILTGISVSSSHSLGGSIQSAKYYLASGIISVIPGLIFYPVTKDNKWIGLGVFLFWIFLIGILYMAADAKLVHVTAFRFTAMNLNNIFLYPKQSDGEAYNYYYSTPVQCLICDVLVYLISVCVMLIFPTRWVIKLPTEFAYTLKNCHKMFALMIKLSRHPKEITPLPKLDDLLKSSIVKPKPMISEEDIQREMDEKKLVDLSRKLIKNIRWLYSMLEESKLERWVSTDLQDAETEIVHQLDRLVGHLVTMQVALGQGFIKSTTHDIFPKISPLFDLLSIRFNAHIEATRDTLLHAFLPPRPKKSNNVEEVDAILMDTYLPKTPEGKRHGISDISELISQRYMEIIKEKENRVELKSLATGKVARMNLYLWQLIGLVSHLQLVEEAVNKFNDKIHGNNSWKLRHAVPHVLIYPFYDIYLTIKAIGSQKARKEYFISWKEIWKNKMYRYPVRLALAAGAVGIATIYVSEVLPNSKQGWSVTTLVMVTTPTLGATLKRGFHRVIGTFIGVVVGEITIIMATYADPLAIILCVTAIFAPITIYLKYSSLYQKSYSMSVAVPAFLVVAYPAYPHPDFFNWGPAVYRAGNVLAGVIVGILAALPFPVLSYKKLQTSVLSTVKASADVMQALTHVDELGGDRYNELCARLREITSAIQPQARLLKEAKSELVLARKRRKMLMKVTKHTAYISFFLIAAREICKDGFSQNMIKQVFEPLREDLNDVGELAQIQAQLFKKFLKKNVIHPGNKKAARKMQKILKRVQRRHMETSKFNYNNKKLHTLHPEMLKFNAYLFTMRSVIRRWEKLIKWMKIGKQQQKPKKIRLVNVSTP